MTPVSYSRLSRCTLRAGILEEEMKLNLLKAYASPLALAFGLATTAVLAVPSASAQAASEAESADALELIDDNEKTEDEDTARMDRVVVTGSFIQGTPEDASIPVQVIDLEELQNMGSPNAVDLVKTMTAVSGVVAGESNRYNSFALNYATVNLRGLGANRTLILLNGKRFAEQYGYGRGRAVNVNQIPMNALSRVETLTDGGAATYGSDALGGVVNYVTRHSFDGLELGADYRAIADTDGQFGFDVLWGNTFDNGDNLLVSMEVSKQSILRATDRDFINLPFLDNPNDQGWNQFGNPGTLALFPGAGNGVGDRISPLYPTFYPPRGYTGDYQMGPFGTVRDPGCEVLGGFAGWSGSAPRCYFDNDNAATLSDDVTTVNLYTEFNSDLTENIHMRLEAGYYNANVRGSTNPSNNFFTGGRLPGTAEQHVPGYNPAVADLLPYFTNADGSSALTSTQVDGILNDGSVRLAVWTPFTAGGDPLYGDSGYHDIETNQGFMSASIEADLPEFLGFNLNMTNTASYYHTIYNQSTGELRSDRLAAALYGYGGEDCAPNADGTDVDPGTNGCLFFNPFSSAIQSNHYTGAENTHTYNSDLVNDPALLDWMLTDIWNQRTSDQFTYDLIFSGETPFQLPGGPIKAAFGAQYRFNRTDDRLSDNANHDITRNVCDVPESVNPVYLPANLSGLLSGCTNDDGALFYARTSTVLGPSRENTRRYPVAAVFYEFQGDVFDNLKFTTAGRWEKFYSDLSDYNAETFVPAFSARWQANDWMAFRGTWGKSFTYISPNSPRPANVSTSIGSVSGLNGNYEIGGDSQPRFTVANYVNSTIEPEKGTNLNVGALFGSPDGKFRANLDYFEIEIEDYVREINVSQLFDALTGGENPGPNALISCDSSLLTNNNAASDGRPTFELNTACVQGTSTLSNAFGALDPADAGRVNYFSDQTNGGTYTVSGIDFGASYIWEDVFEGDFKVALQGTKNLTNGLDDFYFDGALLAEGFDGVGYTNSSPTNSDIGPVAEWRSNLTFNYKRGDHNLNLMVRYISGLTNDRVDLFEEHNSYNPNIGDANGYVSCSGNDQDPVYIGVPTGAGSGTNGDRTVIGGRTVVGLCPDTTYTILKGNKLDPHVTLDLSYRVQLPWDSTFQATVYNLLDTDPEFHRSRFSYNTYLGSPYGRNAKVEFKKRF